MSFGKKIYDLSDLTPDVRSYPVLQYRLSIKQQMLSKLIDQMKVPHLIRSSLIFLSSSTSDMRYPASFSL